MGTRGEPKLTKGIFPTTHLQFMILKGVNEAHSIIW